MTERKSQPKRKPGRPRLGKKPMTAAERVAAHAAAARAAGKRRLSAWLDPDVYADLQEFAEIRGIPIADAIAALLRRTKS
jgi:hypothetical protein